MGRPTKLDQPVGHDEHGHPITAADKIIEAVTLGLDQTSACDLAGINRTTLHNWRLAAGRHRAEQAQGRLPKPTKQQSDLITFLNNLEKAIAEAEHSRLAIIGDAAKGKLTRTKTVTRTLPDGKIETTVTEETAPQWQAAAWWLERRRHQKYARRVEVTGADGTPLVSPDGQAKSLADSMRAYLAGVNDTTKEDA